METEKAEKVGLVASQGLKGLLAAKGIWLHPGLTEKEEALGVQLGTSLPAQQPCPTTPTLPCPGHSSGSYLQTPFISTHQDSRQGVRKEGERKLRHSVLDAALLKRNAKYLTASLTYICGMAFLFHHPL